jgi:hypothetical protein
MWRDAPEDRTGGEPFRKDKVALDAIGRRLDLQKGEMLEAKQSRQSSSDPWKQVNERLQHLHERLVVHLEFNCAVAKHTGLTESTQLGLEAPPDGVYEVRGPIEWVSAPKTDGVSCIPQTEGYHVPSLRNLSQV